MTLNQYGDREFEDEADSRFSSYAYLVGLMRSIDRHVVGVKATSEELAKKMCANADATIAAWLSLLPKSKRCCIQEGGNTDYLILRAYSCIYMYVHLLKLLVQEVGGWFLTPELKASVADQNQVCSILANLRMSK
jgi:cyanate lyase